MGQPTRNGTRLRSTAIAVVALFAGLRVETTSMVYDAPLSAEQTTPGEPNAFTSAKSLSADVASRFPRYLDLAELLGMEFVFHSDINVDRFYLPEIMGGGVAWTDYDLDGWQDIYLVNGGVLPTVESDLANCGELFRNHEGRFFAPTAESAGLKKGCYGQGVAAADFDNDGFHDLYLSALESNLLFCNNGDGTFSQIAQAAGVRHGGWSSSCAWGDVNRDGILDLYVTNYVTISLEANPVCQYQEPTGMVRGYCGPVHYQGEPDALYAGLGERRFCNITNEAGCAIRDQPEGKGLAVAIADLTNDGWPDIFVANDMMENFLFVNYSGRKFINEAMTRGVAYKGDGQPGAGMGIACADYDHNGWLDLYVTHYLRESNTLYQNRDGSFLDATAAARLHVPTLPFLAFGTMCLDCDNDSWPDIFVANGHVLGPNIQPGEMRPQLFRNLGNATFVEATDFTGPYFFNEYLGRGAAAGDYDNDGGMDIAVSHLDRPASLLHNETTPRGAFLGLDLVGSLSNRSAIHTRVELVIDGKRLVHEIVGGGSYLSSNDLRPCVGLGVAERADAVTIVWPSGRVDRLGALDVNRYWTLVEGRPWPAPAR